MNNYTNHINVYIAYAYYIKSATTCIQYTLPSLINATTCYCYYIYTVRELLSFYEFPGDAIPVIKGSALAAATGGDTKLGRDAILELMNAVEAFIPTPVRETEKPFLMPVEDTFSISGRGTVVTGRIEMGKIKTGEDLEVVGLVPTQKTICTGKYALRFVLYVYM